MLSFLIRHLAESTVFALALSAVACSIRRNAAARYAVWFLAAGKFALPTIALSRTGEQLAALLPAAPWLSLLTYRVSVLITQMQSLLPFSEWRSALLVVWLGGSIAMLFAWQRKFSARHSGLIPPSELERQALLLALLTLPTSSRVSIRRSHPETEPALMGLVRPVITLPAGLSEKLTAAELQGILLHELAHARRFDNLTAALVHTLRCLFWFHPLLWFIERRLNLDRELCCDATVLAAGVRPELYAAGILKVCRFHLFDGAAPSGVSAMTGADVRQRLDRILSNRSEAAAHRLLYVPWLLMAALTIFMTLIPVAGGYCAQCSQAATAIDSKTLNSGRK